jgi:hypothetical protein
MAGETIMIDYKPCEYPPNYLERYDGTLGPHEGVELEMMLAGQKPLTMLNDDTPEGWVHPTTFFQPFINAGIFVARQETYTNFPPHHRGGIPMYYHYIALPKEERRIEEMHQLNIDFYVKKIKPTPEMERRVGELLGYMEQDIEAWLEGLFEE